MNDPYDVLGVSRNASDDEIKRAYRQLAKKYHPDKPGGNKEKFAEVSTSYESIKNAEARAQQNNRIHINRGFGNNPFENFDDVFGQMFGQMHRPRNKDIAVTFFVTIEDILNSNTKNIDIKLNNYNNRQVSIKIPRGVKDGSQIRYQGFGDNSQQGRPGDLLVTFKLKNDTTYTVEDYDIVMKLSVTLGEAMMGTEKEIHTPDKKHLSLKIRPGTQNGTRLRIPESGLPRQNKPNGNFYIEIKVNIPMIEEKDLDLTLRNFLFDT